MLVSEEVLTVVKNTFIEVAFKRVEKQRTRTIPSNFKFLGIVDDADLAFEGKECAIERTTSGDSTLAPSSRSRASSGRTTPRTESDCSDGLEVGYDDIEVFVRARHRPWWFGQVWKLARDRQGCRQLQSALEMMSDEGEKLAILSEFHGHVQEACRSPNANYVLQKCIMLMSPVHLQFILHEITCKGARAASMVARHKYGCRIIQRLLEHCPEVQTMLLAEQLLVESEARESCVHIFGNYTMQHLYQYGSAAQRQQLVSLLVREAHTAKDSPLCTVMGKVLVSGDRSDQQTLALALQSVPGLLADMVETKLGQFAAKRALQVLNSR